VQTLGNPGTSERDHAQSGALALMTTPPNPTEVDRVKSLDETPYRSSGKRIETWFEERHRLLSRTEEVNHPLRAMVEQCFDLLQHPLDYGVLPAGKDVFESPLDALASFANICYRLKLLSEDELCSLDAQCRTALFQRLATEKGSGY